MKNEKELAYRYDLFVTPDWRDRYDTLINEQVELPAEGHFLDVNSGTGGYAIELAERLQGKGEVIATDSSAERIELSQAKAQVKKTDNVSFEQASPTDLPYRDDRFDAVIGDASMLSPDLVEEMIAELVRVASPGSKVVVKMATRGSFDEFFSIYWEALLGAGIVDEVWGLLENMINERSTISDAERLVERAGLTKVEIITSKESFLYDSGNEFLESPLINDNFLEEWLSIVPENRRQDVYKHLAALIDRELHDGPFEVSIKATVITGVK